MHKRLNESLEEYYISSQLIRILMSTLIMFSNNVDILKQTVQLFLKFWNY